ncbi:MAG: OsmC family protein [Deltaproteobacteria bacterium]|nr:OsmC family protein [Deltaproteobacteria bacterium]
MNEQQPNLINGLNTDQMGATIRAIGDQPVIAKFQFRASNKWLGGGRNQTTASDFDGACQRHVHEKPHVLDSDEPTVLLGADDAANPAQHALHALAACICSSLVIHATARGITLRSIESTLEGDVDLHGALGLNEAIRNGFDGIRVAVKVEGDAPTEVLDELVKIAESRSPVVDMLRNATPLTVRRVQ